MQSLAISLFQVAALFSQAAGDEDWQRHIEAGKRLLVQGRHEDAEREYLHALSLAEKLGSGSYLPVSLRHLAVLHQTVGRPAQAESLARRAVRLRDIGGVRSIDFAEDLRVLGLVLYYQRRFREARPVFRRSLLMREELQGPDHPDLTVVLGNLAALELQEQQDGQAEQLYRRAISIQMRGPEDENLSKTLNNLGVLYLNLGRYVQAEPRLRHALRIQESITGPDHPEAATIIYSLARVRHKLRYNAEAMEMYTRCLTVWEKAFGPGSPVVARVLNDIAVLHYTDKRYDKAEPLYKRAIDIYDSTPPDDRWEVATTVGNLARLYLTRRRYAEAEPLLLRLLNMRQALLGDEHKSVAEVLKPLAEVYQRKKQYAKAEHMLSRYFTAMERSLGPNAPETTQAAADHARVIRKMQNSPAGPAQAQ